MAQGATARAIEAHEEGQGAESLTPLRKTALALGPALFLATVALPTPPSAAQAAAAVGANPLGPQIALGTLLWMVTWWVSEALPLGVATLVVPLVFGVSGILPWKTGLASYADPILWIFMAGFTLAAAFQKWGLNQRVSVRLALAYKGNDPRVATLFVACLPVFFLTLTGSITASTSIVLPFVSAYLAMLGLAPGSKYASGTMLALAQAATAGAMLLIISTPPNLIAKATIQSYAPQQAITFADWLVVGTPMAFAGLFITWFVTFRILKPETKTISIDRGKMEETRRALGRLSLGERVVAGLLVLTVVLWTVPSLVKIMADGDPGWRPLSTTLAQVMPESMPAVLAMLLAGTLRVRGEPILRWGEIARGIDWNIVFLFGGGIALGLGLEASGFARWLANGVVPLLGPSPDAWVIFAICALLGFALTYAASNTAAALIACPLAATIALGAGVSPVPPVLAAAIAASISSALPSTTPPMAIVHSSGYVKIWDMFRVGLVSDLLRLGVLIALGPPLASLLT